MKSKQPKQHYFFKGKGKMNGVAVDLAGRFTACNPTAKDAFAAALAAYPTVKFETVTFAPVVMKPRRSKHKTYTHQDASGMAWRMVGSRPVSALADKVMSECGLPLP